MRPLVVINALNLTTAAGRAVAWVSGCAVRRRGDFWEATGYHWGFPQAGAFTVGCVVIGRERVADSVWEHEVSHMRQYALLGPLFVPAYGLAAAWSWMRTGDWWSRNVFERRAGLVAGGYVERPLRRSGRLRPGGTGVGAGVA